MTTTTDIAREAGVSRPTVHNVLHGTGRHLPETRRRVLDAARRLGYGPTRTDDETWRTHAACAGHDPGLFFPDPDDRRMQAKTAEAKAVCHRCPVREQCLAWALDHRIEHGVWGGHSARQLKALGPAHRGTSKGAA